MKSVFFLLPPLALVIGTWAGEPPPPEPDTPKSFGLQTAWYAVKTPNHQSVVDNLKLFKPYPAGWVQGLKAGDQGLVFVTPSVNGWTFIVGVAVTFLGKPPEEEPCLALLKTLSEKFGEAQYFSTHRTSEVFAWARAEKGQVVRAYAFNGDEGQALWDVGAKSKEETALGFNFGEMSSPERKSVTDLAGRWSVDPTQLDKVKTPPAAGIAGKLQP